MSWIKLGNSHFPIAKSNQMENVTFIYKIETVSKRSHASMMCAYEYESRSFISVNSMRTSGIKQIFLVIETNHL